MFALSVICAGCKFPKIGISISITPQGKANVVNQKTMSEITVSDAMNASTGSMNSLVDVDSALTVDSTAAPQALVTVTTDNGQTFSQSFAMTQTGASSFAPASSYTITNAFVTQNPSAVNEFIRSAASHAASTVTIDVQTSAVFQGPTDGSSHTIYGRQYTPSDGVTNIGSGSYVAPDSGCGGGPLPTNENQICP
jgi:hypothetical protein